MTTQTEAPLDRYRPLDYILIACVFSLMGGFFWAIRGTGGYGGEDGGVLAGLGWAMLWYGFSRWGGSARRRPLGSGHVIAAITLGIMWGGFTGYGVYNGWIRGNFYLDYPEGVRPIAPWWGFLALFICGLHWGGGAGAALAWCLPGRRLGAAGHAGRWVSGIGTALAAAWLVRVVPGWFLPFFDEGIYSIEENATCIRAQKSLETIAPHVGVFLGFLGFEAARREWRRVALMLVVSISFALPFCIGGGWHRMHGSELSLPWWKFWEMSIGLGGGLAFGLAFWLFNRPEPEGSRRPVTFGERFWATALVIGVGVTNILRSAWDGVVRTHELTPPDHAKVIWVIVLGLIAAVILGRWFWKTRHAGDAVQATGETADTASSSQTLPLHFVGAVLVIIVACGYAVSIPQEVHLNNKVLLGAYTFYIAASAAAIGVIARGRRAND